jgi:Holliday junction resolvase-like predicted endonuclease
MYPGVESQEMTKVSPSYKYLLYVKDSSVGGSSFESLKSLLDQLEKKEENFKAEIVNVSSLTEAQKDKIAADIRAVPPQVRGRVVSGGGMTLALSRTKNLNFDNTSILLIRDDSDRPVAVFPHALEEKVESVEDHLRDALEVGVDVALHQKKVPTEELLTEIISTKPSMVEDGVKVLGREYPTPTGIIDLLLIDRNGTPIVVEVEVTATEQAVGQVSKLAEGYMELMRKQTAVDREQTRDVKMKGARKAIVCLKTKGKLQQACENANVELYQLTTERLK